MEFQIWINEPTQITNFSNKIKAMLTKRIFFQIKIIFTNDQACSFLNQNVKLPSIGPFKYFIQTHLQNNDIMYGFDTIIYFQVISRNLNITAHTNINNVINKQ